MVSKIFFLDHLSLVAGNDPIIELTHIFFLKGVESAHG